MARHSMAQGEVPKSPAADGEILTRVYVLPQRVFIQAAIIALAAIWIYWPALHGDWIWDDSLYISDNPLLHEPSRLWKAWFVPGSFIEYYPIEQTLQWIQWRLWGTDTLGYHLTNVGLHVLNALLVWRLLAKLGLHDGWLGGLIFAVHPLTVESVAWIAEFKNALSLAPCLLAFCAWIDYDTSGSRRDYLRSLAWFLVAMLCKIGVAPLAPILLLHAWWKHGTITWRAFLATAPFFVVAVGLGALSSWSGKMYMQSLFQVMDPVELRGMSAQFVLAGQCLAFYFARFFWPLGPLPIYPQWEVNPASPWQYWPWAYLLLAAGWLWTRRASWGRHALFGLGFFVVAVAPCIGLMPISYLTFTWVMDHFMYLPIIGLIALVAAACEQIDERLSVTMRPLGLGCATLILFLLAWESHWYASAFTGDETLWTYTVERNPGAYLAHGNLGKILLHDGEPGQALEHFDTVIRLRPDLGQPYNDRGTALAALGRSKEATAAFEEALQRDPFSPEANNNLGIIFAQGGKMNEAIQRFEQALHHHPSYVDAHNNLGNALLTLGHVEEAIAEYRTALSFDPVNLNAHDNLGIALAGKGQIREAVENFQQALQINPNDDKARASLLQIQQAEGGK